MNLNHIPMHTLCVNDLKKREWYLLVEVKRHIDDPFCTLLHLLCKPS